MKLRKRWVFGLLISILLAGCGGDSSSETANAPTGDSSSEPEVLIAAGTWSQPQVLETLATDATQPAIALDVNGRAAVTWRADLDVYLNIFDGVSGSWALAEEHVAELNTPPLAPPAVAVDALGDTLVAWQANESGGYSPLRYNFRDDAGDWSGSYILADYVSGVSAASAPPKLAMNSTGQGLAVWNQNSASSYGWYENLWIRLFDGETAQWNESFNLNYSNTGGPAGDYYSNSFDPQVAANEGRSVILVWKRTPGFYTIGSGSYQPPMLKAMAYDVIGGWRGLARIDNEVELPSRAKPVIDAAGNATVVWLQAVDGVNSLYYNRLLAGEEDWSGATLLESGAGEITNFDLTVDVAGNVLVVWDQEDDSVARLFFSRFDIGSGVWSVPAYELDAFGPVVVGMDQDGNAVAAWSGDGSVGIYASRYNPEAANAFWSLPERLDALPGLVSDPIIAVNPAGNTFVAWVQDDGTADSIYASYLETGVSP